MSDQAASLNNDAASRRSAAEADRLAVRSHHFYRRQQPEVDELVVARVASEGDFGFYLELEEYAATEAICLMAQVSQRRRKKGSKVLRAGSQVVVQVLFVDSERGHIDVSRKRVTPADKAAALARFRARKTCVSIVLHAATVTGTDGPGAMDAVLYRLDDALAARKADATALAGADEDDGLQGAEAMAEAADGDDDDEHSQIPVYSSAFEVFRAAAGDPAVLDGYLPDLDENLREVLLREITKRLASQRVTLAMRVRARCLTHDGVAGLRAAFAAGAAVDSRVDITSVASPVYALSLPTRDRAAGVATLKAVAAAIGGELAADGCHFSIISAAHVVEE